MTPWPWVVERSPTQKKDATTPSTGPSSPEKMATQREMTPYPRMQPSQARDRTLRIVAAISAIGLGIAHPFFTELSKSAYLHEFEGGVLVRDTRRVMPFHLITLTLASQTLAVLIAAYAVVYRYGSFKVAARELLDPRIDQVLPIGILYGLGDFLQTIACNKSSTPVVLLVGQSKLFLSALLSNFFLGSQLNCTKWIRLLTISLAAMASTYISASDAPVHSEAVYGALLAFMKAGLSSAGAVWSERVYKGSGQTDFWVVSFRVQLSMLLTSVVLLLVNNDYQQLGSGLFSGGPYVPCTGDIRPVQCEEYICKCSTTTGWDWKTCLAMVAIILNGYVTGFFLKHLSAVCKAVCNVGSSGLCCVTCWLLGYVSCTPAQVCVTGIVLLNSGEYAVEKASACSSTKRTEEAHEWTTQYPKAGGAQPDP